MPCSETFVKRRKKIDIPDIVTEEKQAGTTSVCHLLQVNDFNTEGALLMAGKPYQMTLWLTHINNT